MRRRSFVSVSGATVTTALAGCLGRLQGNPDDEYDTAVYDDREIPLVPLEDAHEWYEAGDAQFVDTRGPGQYASAHVEGAILSPPTSSSAEGDDALEDVPADTRLVTYCDCPHSLAVMRASELRADGFEDVYALDDGFPAWEEAGHPTERDDGTAAIDAREIVGRSSPDHEGEYVWLTTLDGSQTEITQVESGGVYKLTVRFADVDDETVLSLEAPDYELEATLETLTDGEVRA